MGADSYLGPGPDRAGPGRWWPGWLQKPSPAGPGPDQLGPAADMHRFLLSLLLLAVTVQARKFCPKEKNGDKCKAKA